MQKKISKPIMYNNIDDSSLIQEMNPYNVKIGPNSSDYRYNGKVVPRVTTILSDMLHEEALMGWANYMGLQNIKHTSIQKESTEIGTKVHEAIENFVKTGHKETFYGQVNAPKKINAFVSFLKWWTIISNNNNVHILMIEQNLICEYYGGTLDMLIEINGKVYLVDFKTSKKFIYKHHLQLAAYRRLLYSECNITIDGAIILRLSKDEDAFQEQLIYLWDYNHLMYMNQCDECFLSLVYAFYNRKTVEHSFNVGYM